MKHAEQFRVLCVCCGGKRNREAKAKEKVNLETTSDEKKFLKRRLVVTHRCCCRRRRHCRAAVWAKEENHNIRTHTRTKIRWILGYFIRIRTFKAFVISFFFLGEIIINQIMLCSRFDVWFEQPVGWLVYFAQPPSFSYILRYIVCVSFNAYDFGLVKLNYVTCWFFNPLSPGPTHAHTHRLRST